MNATATLTYEPLFWTLLGISIALILAVGVCVFRIAYLKIWHSGDLVELSKGTDKEGNFEKKSTKWYTITAITCAVLAFLVQVAITVVVTFQTVTLS